MEKNEFYDLANLNENWINANYYGIITDFDKYGILGDDGKVWIAKIPTKKIHNKPNLLKIGMDCQIRKVTDAMFEVRLKQK